MNGQPCYLSSEIIINKYENKLEQLKDKIQKILKKENVTNNANFSI